MKDPCTHLHHSTSLPYSVNTVDYLVFLQSASPTLFPNSSAETLHPEDVDTCHSLTSPKPLLKCQARCSLTPLSVRAAPTPNHTLPISLPCLVAPLSMYHCLRFYYVCMGLLRISPTRSLALGDQGPCLFSSKYFRNLELSELGTL